MDHFVLTNYFLRSWDKSKSKWFHTYILLKKSELKSMEIKTVLDIHPIKIFS